MVVPLFCFGDQKLAFWSSNVVVAQERVNMDYGPFVGMQRRVPPLMMVFLS